MDNEETNSSVEKKARRIKIANETGKCSRCPPHDKENRRKRKKTDKYKNKRGQK